MDPRLRAVGALAHHQNGLHVATSCDQAVYLPLTLDREPAP